VSIAPLTTSESGFGLTKLATKLPNSPVGALPVMTVPNPVSAAVALSIGKSWVGTAVASYKASVASWMASRGISMAFVTFTQEANITSATGVKKQALSFNMVVDNKGRATYGVPKLVDPDPIIVDAVYTPAKADSGLPSTWAYPDAGTLKYRILDKKGNALSGWAVIPTGGAFDEPDTTGAEYNPDETLKCLMDLHYPGCSGPVDIRTLMEATGASSAFVNYIRKIQPRMQAVSADEEAPVSALSVDERIWDCDTYTNKGHFGFVLDLKSSQYMAAPSSTYVQYSLYGELSAPGISPTESYVKSVPVSALGGANPNPLIINPLPGDDSLVAIGGANSLNVLYAAPVVTHSSADILSGIASTLPVSASTLADGSYKYLIGANGDNYWSGGGSSGLSLLPKTYDNTITFSAVKPASAEKVLISHVAYDDYLLIAVNGTIVFDGPYGGDTLMEGNTDNPSSCTLSGDGGTDCLYVDYSATANYVGTAGLGGTCPAGFWNLNSVFNPCYKVTQAHHAAGICSVTTYVSNTSESGGSDASTETWTCNSRCPTGKVQFLLDTKKNTVGCGEAELSRNNSYDVNINIKPYLQEGQNTIFMRTIVGGKGDTQITMNAYACGAGLGLPTSTSQVPPGASAVTNVLKALSGP
jgi:hypothetical protein